MKIRNGFVSNSSTSSFCLFGVCVENSDVINAALKLDEQLKEELGEDELDSSEAGEIVAEKLDLEYCMMEGGWSYFGRDPSTLKDDETGAQFKESVRAKTEPIFPGVELSWYQEGWYDG